MSEIMGYPTGPVRIPRRTDLPTEKGWYLVHESGSRTPMLLRWSEWSKRWEFPRSISTVNAVGWIGPILGVKDDLADV